ncbi:putative p-type calcium atpase protein [Phaeoacremonium minimum UCRPA7]|uniref:Putative P-type calcium atpase protein n=1 Tax=Phaeoacremonium minimum (strain UCR-PA7) TaxID=1286976 RepID=R8BT61_PHAM7|nr:putative p-type calcium atpase protein [Phaeoacremonium minimum UCRPA7]EOO02455.1 putative p-type calcium atpase protein [Phaeoacremonium minimum UCRPA7]
MFLLAVSATISLVLGISQEVVLGNSMGSNTGWAQSAAIIGAIVITVTATAANDYQKNYKFERLQQRTEERWVTAIRSGKSCHISIYDIVVGDVLLIDTGDILPADGILVEASQILCDESHLSGESELVRKIPADQYGGDSTASPFVFSGAIVSQGIGTYVVTAVGMNLTSGRIAMALHNRTQQTPLQQRLGRLAKRIIIVSSIIGAVYFLILFIRWLVQLKSPNGPKTARDKGESFLDVFMIAATVIVIGVPEGLSLAVSVALAFATTRMLRDNNLVRLLRSCEVMGNATCICTDKTGTLTTNDMNVMSGVIGCDEKFGPNSQTPPDVANPARSNLLSASELAAQLAIDVRGILKSSIALNSTAFEQGGSGSGNFGGSSTEIALLRFARDHLGMASLAQQRANAEIVELFPFDTDRKYMGVVIRWGDKFRLLVKGAPEIIISNCSTTLESTMRNWNPREELISTVLREEKRAELEDAVYDYACKRYRTIAMAYRDLESWPPVESTNSEGDPIDLHGYFDEAFREQMTFVALFALRDPLRPEVVESIRKCQDAGVFVRMVTGDNLATAEAIALESGIFTAGGIAMDGPTFRRLTPKQMDAVIPRLQVLARSTADDKAQLVMALKRLGETVAVTGDGTNDAFALKAADVGFSMGKSGTQVAKDASSIVLLDDNFASIVKAVAWGRGISDATKKYCQVIGPMNHARKKTRLILISFEQFQFTLNITAVIITVISTLVGDVDSSVFNVVQLLWLNLILDILAGLALSTDYPRPYLMRRKPEPRSASLISLTMWKMILGQSIYQLAVIFTMQYAGGKLWSEASDDQAQTVVFNTYMFIQLFNQIK